MNRQAYVKLIIFSFCHCLEANQSPMVDVPVFILCTDGQSLLDSVKEARDYWKRNFAGFLANFSLERREGCCLPAFVIDHLLYSRPEIFDRPKESDAKKVGFFGNKLDLLLQEGKGVIFHVGLWANGVRGRRGLGQRGLGQMGLGANVSGQCPHGKQHPGLPATTGQVCSHGANPPCIASLRPIKDFWAALKKAV